MRNMIITFLIIGFSFVGCSDKDSSDSNSKSKPIAVEKVQLDKEGMKLVDTYLADLDLQAFHSKLKTSRFNIIESYEKEYTKEYSKDVKLNLTYDKKTYDKDFENEVQIAIKSDAEHRVQLKSAFFNGIVKVSKEGFSKTFLVKDVAEKDLKVTITKVLPSSTKYKTQNYKNL